MRGISEERLIEILNSYPSYRDERIVIEEILTECSELNEFKPIDDSTPKDRRVMLYYKNYGVRTGSFMFGHYLVDTGLSVPCNIKPTPYQELPEPPKD